MDKEHIKPSKMSTFHAILYSPPHLLMSFSDRHILMQTIATYIRTITQQYMVEVM